MSKSHGNVLKFVKRNLIDWFPIYCILPILEAADTNICVLLIFHQNVCKKCPIQWILPKDGGWQIKTDMWYIFFDTSALWRHHNEYIKQYWPYFHTTAIRKQKYSQSTYKYMAGKIPGCVKSISLPSATVFCVRSFLKLNLKPRPKLFKTRKPNPVYQTKLKLIRYGLSKVLLNGYKFRRNDERYRTKSLYLLREEQMRHIITTFTTDWRDGICHHGLLSMPWCQTGTRPSPTTLLLIPILHRISLETYHWR